MNHSPGAATASGRDRKATQLFLVPRDTHPAAASHLRGLEHHGVANAPCNLRGLILILHLSGEPGTSGKPCGPRCSLYRELVSKLDQGVWFRADKRHSMRLYLARKVIVLRPNP